MSSPASAEVISLTARAAHRINFRGVASAQLLGAREKLGTGREEFAGLLSDMTGWDVDPDLIGPWEHGRGTPPADVLLAARHLAGDETAEPGGVLLGTVPHGFPAEALAGPWATCYHFGHGGELLCHADIAWVTAESARHIRAANHPPEPRSEGRASPFRNVIEAQLAGRHLVGQWRNTSDTRYFGSLQLAVLPGETIMEGYYAGVGSDIQVSSGYWKWARLDPASLADTNLAAVTLREPATVYDLVMKRSPYDAPLTLADVREEA